MSLNGLDKIEGLTPEMQEQINVLAKGLADKNADLLGKLSSNKDASAISAAELENLRTFKKSVDQKLLEEGQQYEEAKQNMLKSHNEDINALNERIKAYEQNERSRLITDGARKQLTDIGVNPLHMDSVMALVTSQSKVDDGKAMIGEQTQAEYISAWSETDSGKASILGQQNSNSGGLGGDNTPVPETNTNEAAETAAKNGDAIGHLNAHLQANLNKV